MIVGEDGRAFPALVGATLMLLCVLGLLLRENAAANERLSRLETEAARLGTTVEQGDAPAARPPRDAGAPLAPQGLAAQAAEVKRLTELLRPLLVKAGQLRVPGRRAPAPDPMEALRQEGLSFSYEHDGPDLSVLRKITLPVHPTREQLRDYVRRILDLCSTQNSAGGNDPQVGMLTKVGPENLDLLLEAAGRTRPISTSSLYLTQAIASLAREEDKSRVIAALPHCRQLLELVVNKGWTNDARETLLEEFRRRPDHLETEWIEAVASLHAPETYRDLTDYFVNGPIPGRTYETLKAIPDFDLNGAVGEAWSSAKRKEGEASYFAPFAIAQGYADGLEFAVRELATGPRWRLQDARAALIRYTEASGTDEEIRQWYEDNRTRLVFDRAQGRWIVPK